MKRANEILDFVKRELVEELTELERSRDFWHKAKRELAEQVMRAAGLPDDFSTAGTDAAFAKIAEFKSWYDHTFPKEG